MLSALCSRPAKLTGLFEQKEVLFMTNSPKTEDNADMASEADNTTVTLWQRIIRL